MNSDFYFTTLFRGGSDEQDSGIQEAPKMDAGRTGETPRRRTLRRREMGKWKEPAASCAARGAG